MAFAVVSAFIPTLILDIAAGIVFGPLWGTVYAVIGAEVGALVAFFVARKSGRGAIARRLNTTSTFATIARPH